MFLALAISWVAVAACTSSTDDDGADTDQSSGAGAGAAQGSGVGGSGAAQSSGVGGAGECGSLTQWEQKMLDAHNSWRSSVEPPAANMYRAYWDVTIAQNAAAWVSSCDPEWPHSSDESRTDIGGYDVLGENLSYCAGTGCNDDPNITDGSGMGDGEGWWAERSDYNWQDDSSTGITSHYTQMVSSNVYAIGCATQLCSAPGPSGWDADWWWTICQYGPRGQGYWNGTKPYDAGDGELVEPPDTVFADHPGLCATQ
jgi:hypothetical protein